ncbi:Uncharacterised protein [Enterobacter cloacae]|uniref:Uncharacterized protein n=1 Tax=Enterobacter cloacae TaxID=550 RepID=A0A377M1V9_ENTCL|nr:Uncharacterised protein [Enterobacter cloacae]
MMQQSQTLFESSVLSATSFRTVYHEHGRYKTINGNSFVHDGHAYRINTRIGSGVRHDILISTINELNAILKLYSRVFLTRFDLHLPEFTSVEAGNKYIRNLFKRLRDRLGSGNNGLSNLLSILLTVGFANRKRLHNPITIAGLHFHIVR